MRKVLVILGSIILISIFSCATMEKGYQENADQIRLQHLRYYGDLLDEYHVKTGKLPFQGEYDIPVYITIANDFQKKNANQQLPFENKKISSEQFKQELEKVLERDITLMYDPQKVGVYAPNFYIYSVYQKVFYFGIHLYDDYDFTNNISKHYNKVELTNNEIINRGQIHYDKLCQIVKHKDEKPTDEEYTLHTDCDRKYLHQSSYNGLVKNQETRAKEIFVNFHPDSQYLRIKEYKLSTTNQDFNLIQNQINSLKNQIQLNKYASSRFGFSNWFSIEENMYKDREYITSKIDLLTKETNIEELLTDCFEKVLSRPVKVVSTKNLTSLSFNNTGIKHGSCNGTVFQKDNVTLVMWDNLLSEFNIVFSDKSEFTDDLSFFEYFGENAESPRKSEEEIEKWRNE